MSAITATGLRKDFGKHAVLDGISLEVAEGTVFSLLGPNGAGKTTTVNILTTLIRADAGEVQVAGHSVRTEPDAVRAAIGVTALVVLIALAIGYRPTANPMHWLAVIALVTLLLFAIAWIATAMGLAAGTATGAASLAALLQILPFLSSAFVPTATMPGWLQAFTDNQPMTHIVAALRGLLTGTPVGNHAWIAVIWCGGITAAGYLWARTAYGRRTGAAA